MCGINGFNKKDIETLSRMNTCLAHRGPDIAGTFLDDSVSLGHTLLSIRDSVDVSKQPYLKENSPWVIVFNGQLYNTAQLKNILGRDAVGVDLDTELLCQLTQKSGWNFIQNIHGMFAVAIYNKEQQAIRLYRDPSGQKNLYYYTKDKDFIFSSEIKGILSHKDIDMTPDLEAVNISAMLGYIPGEKTLFKHIKKLLPGEVVSFDLNKKSLHRNIYKSDAGGYYTKGDDVFKKLTEEHIQSKQKVSINLSGGLDSSLLLHEMSNLDHSIHTYTNYFETNEGRYNEDALLAKKLSADYGTEHHEIHITPKSYYDNFIESYKAIEEPNYNISLPIYLQTAKFEGVSGQKERVVLSGDGGDELFGGYRAYKKSLEIHRLQKLMTPYIFNLIKNKRNNTNFHFEIPEEQWLFLKKFYVDYLKKNTYATDAYIKNSVLEFARSYKRKRGIVYDIMFLDRFLWLANENFIRSDKLYMSQSIELRSPLSYHPFRYYIDSLLKEGDYVDSTINKRFLREHYKKKLPSYIVERRKKTGWTAPISIWYDKRLKELFLSIISEVEDNNSLIDWEKVKLVIEKTDTWPGKYIHLYLSLAILSKEYNIKI